MIDIDFGEFGDIEGEFVLGFAELVAVDFQEDFEFELAQFAVGDDEEVAAAAGGVEEGELAEFVVEGLEAGEAAGGFIGTGGIELGTEFIEEEGADEFEDVFFGRVVGTDLASLGGIHDALEEGSEDGGGDAGPLEGAGFEQLAAHEGVKIGEGDALGEEGAVDVGEGGEVFIEVGLALVFGGVEDIEEAGEFGAGIRAIEGGAVFEEELEVLLVEDAGVIGEEAEEQADEKDAEIVPGEAAGVEGIVEAGHDLGGLDVGGVLGVEFLLFVAGDEGEAADVFVEIAEGEDDGGGLALEQGEIGILFGFEVVEGDAFEIRNNEPTRDFFFASGIDEAADVFHALGVGFIEVLTSGFLFDEDAAGPEEVDLAPGAGEFFHRFLEGCDGAAFDAEDFEKFVPERLAAATLGPGVFVLAGEGDGAAFDFVPGKHVVSIAKKRGIGKAMSESANGLFPQVAHCLDHRIGAQFVLAASVQRAFAHQAWGAFDFFPQGDMLFAEGPTPVWIVRAEKGNRGGAYVGTEVANARIRANGKSCACQHGQSCCQISDAFAAAIGKVPCELLGQRIFFSRNLQHGHVAETQSKKFLDGLFPSRKIPFVGWTEVGIRGNHDVSSVALRAPCRWGENFRDFCRDFQRLHQVQVVLNTMHDGTGSIVHGHGIGEKFCERFHCITDALLQPQAFTKLRGKILFPQDGGIPRVGAFRVCSQHVAKFGAIAVSDDGINAGYR